MVLPKLSSTFVNTPGVANNLDVFLTHILLSSFSCLAIIFGSKAGLRIWIANNQLPRPPPKPQAASSKDGDEPRPATPSRASHSIEDAQKVEDKKDRRMFLALLCISPISYFLLSRLNSQQLDRYVFVFESGLLFLLFIPLTYAWSLNMLSLMTGPVILRSEIATFNMTKRNPRMKSVLVIAIFSIVVLVVLSPGKTFKWYTYTASIFQASYAHGNISYNVKRAIIPRFMLAVSLLAGFCYAIYYISATGYDTRRMPWIPSRWRKDNDDFSGAFSYAINWVIPAVSNGTSGVLVALALRFDYHKHIKSMYGTEKGWTSHLRNMPHETDDGGVVVPLNAPSFSRTYYLSALTGWFVANASVLALLYINLSTRFYMFILYTPSSWFQTLLYAPLSFFGVLTGMCINGLVHGELSTMLGYTEVWKLDVIVDKEVAEDRDLEKKVESDYHGM